MMFFCHTISIDEPIYAGAGEKFAGISIDKRTKLGTMSEDEIEQLKQAIIKQTEICLNGGAKYGFTYRKQTP